MIKKQTNSAETEYLNKNLNREQEFYDAQDVLDLLPDTIWSGDENDGCSYELYFFPGYRDREISGWTLSYNLDDDIDGVLPVIGYGGSNDGILDAAFKLYIWCNENLEFSEGSFPKLIDSDNYANEKFDKINHALETYKSLQS